MSLNREVVGFEKTLFGSDISLGVRLPFLQTSGAAGTGIAGDIVGDLTLIGKYAVINNRETGNVLSLGLALTVPTLLGGLVAFPFWRKGEPIFGVASLRQEAPPSSLR